MIKKEGYCEEERVSEVSEREEEQIRARYSWEERVSCLTLLSFIPSPTTVQAIVEDSE